MKQVMSECLYCTPGTAPDFPCTVSPAGDVAISHLTDEVLQVCASCPPSHSLEGGSWGWNRGPHNSTVPSAPTPPHVSCVPGHW